MAYQVMHDYLIVTDDNYLIARARGSDAEGWRAMSTAADGLNRPIGRGAFPTLESALRSRVDAGFWSELDSALRRLVRREKRKKG